MRYLPINALEEGMVCGKNLYDVNSQLLLSKGSIIHKRYIQRIVELGYPGVYIEDELSKDLVVKDVISDGLRMSAIKAVKDICIFAEQTKVDKNKFDQKVGDTKKLIGTIVDEILADKDTMVNLIDLKFYDDYTFFHSVNVAVLSIIIGVEYGLSKAELLNLGLAAILHDIGKMLVDKDVLNKPGRLTDEELMHIQEHPKLGYHLLKESYEIPTNVFVSVLQHHERYDGQGYPHRKEKEDILISGRIICIADVYDALTSKRPYREPLLPSEAMEYIMANGGSMFDLKLTKIFSRKIAPFPIGTYVKLSTGEGGIVLENFEDACMRPTLKIFRDSSGEPLKPLIYDMKLDRNLRNVTIIGVNALD